MKNLSSLQQRVVIATSMSYIIVILDTSIVNVALSSVARSLHSTLSGLQWTVNAYTLTFAALLLTGGWLGDKVGARNIYLIGLMMFGIASLLCGVASTQPVLISARVLQGIGASLLVPASLSLITATFPLAHQRGRAIAIWAGCGGLAMATGPMAGGILIEFLGWRSIFLLNVPVVLLAIGLTARIKSPSRVPVKKKFDLAGQLWIIAALSASMVVLIQVGVRGWQDEWLRLGAFIAMISWICFFLTERRSNDPMLPLTLFRLPLFSACIGVSLTSGLIFYGLFFVLSLHFQLVRHWSPLWTGMAFLPLTTLVATGSFLSGKLHKKIGPRWLLTACCLLYAFGLGGMLDLGDDVAYPYLALFFPALGLAAGIITPVATALLMNHVPQDQAGIAAGILNASRQTGAALGVAIFGGLMNAFESPATGSMFAVLLGIVLSLLSAFFWFVRVTSKKSV